MRIYSMTATFGKLEHEKLELQPGLNILEAPNEWGKSTWCAFLVAMFYGIATREHTTKSVLADKDRYAPWSGSPMSGRIDLQWNGRDITIERRTKGRSIFGEFQAYETESGLPIPELTAANCGEKLLGVEKSVFTRSAFLRLTDLPVVQDETLRRRLNALVTTGDESGAGDALAQTLKDLKNRCRSNRANGLIPQALAQKEALEQKLRSIGELEAQALRLQERARELTGELEALENHQAALAYEAAQAELRQLAEAKAAAADGQEKLEALRQQCASLPDRQTAAGTLQLLEQTRLQLAAVQAEALPQQPEQPQVPACFAGCSPEDALQQARSDEAAYAMLTKPLSPIAPILAALLVLGGAALAILAKWYIGLPVALLAALPIVLYLRSRRLQERDRLAVAARYGQLPPEQWVPAALDYQLAAGEYAHRLSGYNARLEARNSRTQALQEQLQQLAGGQPLPDFIQAQQQCISLWDALVRQEDLCRHAQKHADALAAVVQEAAPPRKPDACTYSEAQTQRRLEEAEREQHLLQHSMGQCQGQIQTLGSRAALQDELVKVNARLARLQETYDALELAQNTLAEATGALQRRFAPQLSRRAQELFSQLTGSRYDRLTLAEDLSLHAGAQGEDTLHAALWRSDGTVDQLYLALRLAVAEALMPGAPLILDDALVRFDDRRLQAALQLLKEEAAARQVLLFTCQSREKALL